MTTETKTLHKYLAEKLEKAYRSLVSDRTSVINKVTEGNFINLLEQAKNLQQNKIEADKLAKEFFKESSEEELISWVKKELGWGNSVSNAEVLKEFARELASVSSYDRKFSLPFVNAMKAKVHFYDLVSRN